jgi:NAD(P)-dependent dehydrogenase (short-subunit alcohol dehydrogenase family)
MTRLVLPHMREQGSGSIVNVSSIAGRAAITPQAIYSATKWAVEATSEILAQEVNPLGIQVVVIEPGVVLTPIFGKGDPDYAPSPQYAHLFQRFMQMFGAALPHASSAGGIADSIVEAVESGKPFQRIVDGFAGKEFVAMRESMTDDEWTAYGRKMSNAEANDFFRPALGVDLYTDRAGDE